jgi:hypothetical protein
VLLSFLLPLPLLQWLLFLFQLLLLSLLLLGPLSLFLPGERGGNKGSGSGAGDVLLEQNIVGAAVGPEVSSGFLLEEDHLEP